MTVKGLMALASPALDDNHLVQSLIFVIHQKDHAQHTTQESRLEIKPQQTCKPTQYM
jgi:hypothetical protein